MEPSDASSWFINFEMNYSSFLQDFGQFDCLAPSPMIPDLFSISPECCFTNSNLDPIPIPTVNTTLPPPQNNIANVVTNQAKKQKQHRSQSRNACFINKPRKGTNGEGFDKSDSKDNLNIDSSSNEHRGRKRSYEAMPAVNRENNSSSSPCPVIQPESHKKDHVMAERRRREKITKRFIALSSVIPGLTRMDKGSVLEDATKYVKQLQEKMKTLEAQCIQKNVQAAVIVKQSQSLPDECNSLLDGSFTKAESLPEIEVRFSQQRVLVKIHCERQSGVLVKVLSEIENFGLKISSTTAVPFTSSSLDMTIMAEVDEELALKVEDLVTRLNLAIKAA